MPNGGIDNCMNCDHFGPEVSTNKERREMRLKGEVLGCRIRPIEPLDPAHTYCTNFTSFDRGIDGGDTPEGVVWIDVSYKELPSHSYPKPIVEAKRCPVLDWEGYLEISKFQDEKKLRSFLKEQIIKYESEHGIGAINLFSYVSRLKHRFIDEGLATEEQLQQATASLDESEGSLGFQLVKMGLFDEEELYGFLVEQIPSGPIDLKIDSEVLKLVPEDIAVKYLVLPRRIIKSNDTLILAMADPTNIFAIDEIESMTGLDVDAVMTDETIEIVEAIKANYKTDLYSS